MTSLRLSHKTISVVAALSVLALSACSEKAKAPASDEEIAAVKEQLAPVAAVSVAGATADAPTQAPVSAAPEPAPAASAPAPVEPAPAASEVPAESAATEAEHVEAPAAAETAPVVPVEAAPATAAADGFALASRNACMACHQVDVKLVGPSYKEVADKYRGDPAALDMLVAKVKSGGEVYDHRLAKTSGRRETACTQTARYQGAEGEGGAPRWRKKEQSSHENGREQLLTEKDMGGNESTCEGARRHLELHTGE